MSFLTPLYVRLGKASHKAALLLLVSLCIPKLTTAQTPDEYQVKAVFIFNFLNFIEWPPNTFPSDESPFTITVLGTNVFEQSLNETVQNERINGRAIVVKYVNDPAAVGETHILFIGKDDVFQYKSYLSSIANKPILTVSDFSDFNAEGGIVKFYTEQNKIRFEINQRAAERSGITISSKLLRVAKIYDR